jgi:cell division protein FtsA
LEIKKDGSNNTLIALLAAGKENCCLVMPEPKEPVRPIHQQHTQHVQESLFTESGESMMAALEEEERKRQQEKEAILAQQKAEREAQKAAAEAEIKRKAECEELIQEVVRLKTEEKYGDALKKLKKAASMNVAEKEEAIQTLEKDLKELKEKNSLTGKFTNLLKTLLDED